MQAGYCKEMQKAHAGKAIPGVTVKLPPVTQKECTEDRTRLRIRQKSLQAGLDEGTYRLERTYHTPPVMSCSLYTPLQKIETSIDSLA